MKIEIFVTETWAYFQSQLDRKRRIKLHAVRPGTQRSYCGIEWPGGDWVGETTWGRFRDNEDSCAKCRAGYCKEYKQEFER